MQTRAALLNSIRQRRWPGARYYKPACLLAVLDGVDSGEIDPQRIDPEAVLERFAALVSQLAPEKADPRLASVLAPVQRWCMELLQGWDIRPRAVATRTLEGMLSRAPSRG